MKAIHLCMSLVSIASIASCAPSVTSDSSGLEAGADAWQKAFNAKDAAAVAAVYTEDCRVLPPNGELEQGREAVETIFGEMIAAGLSSKLETLEAAESGDIGYKVGRYALMAPDGTEVDRGKFIETWKRVGGSWQISNDIWNSDLPADSPEARLFVSHEVENNAHWLAAWRGEGSRHEFFAKHGVSNVRVFLSPDDPSLAGLLLDVPSLDTYRALVAAPETAVAMKEDGVKPSTLQVFAQTE